MYTYGLFILMYLKNQHNIVKQLSSNNIYICALVSASRPYSLAVMQAFLIAVASPAMDQGQNTAIYN